MSTVSQKCLYGIRALFELSKHWQSRDLIKLHQIAKAQSIPKRFLENILNQLRQGEFVESRRGKEGGFRLNRHPSEISVGDVIRFIDNSLFPVNCEGEDPSYKCPLKGKCIFLELWSNAMTALESVYNAKTFQHLIEDDNRVKAQGVETVRPDVCVASLPIFENFQCNPLEEMTTMGTMENA